MRRTFAAFAFAMGARIAARGATPTARGGVTAMPAAFAMRLVADVGVCGDLVPPDCGVSGSTLLLPLSILLP
jgi:hypothetical protein